MQSRPKTESLSDSKESRSEKYGKKCSNVCSMVGSTIGFFAGKVHDVAEKAYKECRTKVKR